MGHSTDIFLNDPADSCICAICHDVLKDASSLTDCGHSFCAECINSLYFNSSELSCPTCRTAVTGSTNPNYAVRGIIDALEVSCPDGGTECGWLGKIGELESHSSECLYKTITCGIEGCTHKCQRKDMDAHRSSNEALFKHMELKHERKMSEMEAKLSLRYNGRIDALKSEFNRKLTEMGDIYEQYDGDRQAEIQSCKNNLRSYKSKVDTLEEKVEELEKQIWDKKRKKSIKQTKRSTGDSESTNRVYTFDFNPLDKVVFSTMETMGAGSIDGIHINRITARIVAEGYDEVDIKNSICKLCNWGLMYDTIDDDENTFQSSEEGYLSVLNDTTLQVIKAYSARSNYDGSGVHINRIIADVSALGFNAGDIKDAINYLRNEEDSLVYTTIDENTFAHY